VGDVAAFDAARPVLRLGGAGDVRVTGGDLGQGNSQAVQVSGIGRLRFTAGQDSAGNLLAAQSCRGALQENGVDVTAQVVAASD